MPEARSSADTERGAEARLDALVKKSSDIIAVVGPDATVRYVSPSVVQIMGYREDEVLGRTAFDFVHPDDAGKAFKGMSAVLAESEASSSLELRARHKDGSWRRLEIVLTNLLHDPDVEGVVVNQRDVTEIRRLEEQLIESQKTEVMGRLAGEIAHDFNNLLTVIGGSAELLPRAPKERIGDLIHAIAAASERGRRLTTEMLNLSRREAFSLEALSLSEIVSEMEPLIEMRLGRGTDLRTRLNPKVWTTAMDRGQCEHMLLNLVSNAADAVAPRGTVLIETTNVVVVQGRGSPLPSLGAGRYVLLRIQDDGMGMDAEVRERIFEPYFTTKPRGEGTGLGLSIVHGTVKRAGGDILVASSPGEGTTFEVYLAAT
jgi:two-component system cell cycle sensor histidine kinase/response regulator CckA